MKATVEMRLLVFFCLAAGLMDTISGILLVGNPVLTLRLMQVPVPSASALPFVRFVGAFVFAVGSLYLVAVEERLRTESLTFLYHVLLMTGLVRAVICVFTLIMILRGNLDSSWITVPVTDGLLAILQFTLFLKGTSCNEA